MLAPNTILQKRYRVIHHLGHGGMGAVYEAIDERLSSIVALKETFATTDVQRAAFEREAKLLSNLEHEAFPKVKDHFFEEDGQYLVMEMIRGNDLAQLLRIRESPFGLIRVLEWAYQLLDALEALHSYNPPIIHRDIKPSNLKETPKNKIKLLDFGIAKGAAGQMTTLHTDDSFNASTIQYAPLEQTLRASSQWFNTLSIVNFEATEQVLRQGTDPRSDIYALGATLYHLITNKLPSAAPTRAIAVWYGKPDPLRSPNEINSEVTPDIAAVLMRAMALDRSQRYESAHAMRQALRDAAHPTKSAPVIMPPTLLSPELEQRADERDSEENRQRALEEAYRLRKAEEHERAEAETARLEAEEATHRRAEEESARQQAEEIRLQRDAEEAARQAEWERQHKEAEELNRLLAEETARKVASEQEAARQLVVEPEAENLRAAEEQQARDKKQANQQRGKEAGHQRQQEEQRRRREEEIHQKEATEAAKVTVEKPHQIGVADERDAAPLSHGNTPSPYISPTEPAVITPPPALSLASDAPIAEQHERPKAEQELGITPVPQFVEPVVSVPNDPSQGALVSTQPVQELIPASLPLTGHKYFYPLLIAAGLLILLGSYSSHSFIRAFSICGVLSASLGFIWPHRTWRWGMWVSLPLLFLVGLLIGLSLLLKGYFSVFFLQDIPLLLGVVLSAYLGAYLGARISRRRKS